MLASAVTYCTVDVRVFLSVLLFLITAETLAFLQLLQLFLVATGSMTPTEHQLCGGFIRVMLP